MLYLWVPRGKSKRKRRDSRRSKNQALVGAMTGVAEAKGVDRAVDSCRERMIAGVRKETKPGTWQSFQIRTGRASWHDSGVVPPLVLDVAAAAFDAGDFELTVELVNLVFAVKPRHQRANNLRALVYAASNEWKSAEDSWTRSYSRSADGQAASRRRVRAEQARVGLRNLLPLLPNDLPALEPGTQTAKLHANAMDEMTRHDALRFTGGFDRNIESFLACAALNGQTEGLRPLYQYYARMEAVPNIELAAPELVEDIKWMDVDGFRDFVAGKSVVLVANSPSLLEAELGAQIDSYDVVIRFNSFVIDEPHTGVRTDVHAAFHKYDFNLEIPVQVRILVSGKLALWQDSIKRRIQPGMQEQLGDGTLRWPAVELGLIGPGDAFKLPTVGFNLLRVLMHLDSPATIDLVGFDFYESGMLRLNEALSIAHSSGHESAAERDWILANAVSVDQHTISMK
jgi:hypothetical protein